MIDDDVLNAISRGIFFRNITEINLKGCPKITMIGLLNIARSPNPDFQIQVLLDDFGDKIDSIFIRNMVQQDYFENLNFLNLRQCKILKTEDLLTIIKASHEEFDLELFIKPEYLPNSNSDLITNEVLKAISQSPFFIKKFITDNSEKDEERSYFDFNIKLYRQIDYGINYLIEQNVAPIEDYDDYLNNLAYNLSLKSLDMIHKIYNKGDNREDVKLLKHQLDHVTKLDFSQNKQIYNTSFKSRLLDALDGFQNQHNLNLENETLEYFMAQVIEAQDEFSMTSDADEEFKDIIMFNLIAKCKKLEEINLNNLNLGDYFLKSFSIYITQEKEGLIENLNDLKTFKIRNNIRFTSVGLKYLFCAAVKRTDIGYIDVSFKGQVSSGITHFVNQGLIGMIDYYLKDHIKKLKEIYDKKGNIRKFVLNRRSMVIFIKGILLFPIILFHLFEKSLFYVPACMEYTFKPFKPIQIFLNKLRNSFSDKISHSTTNKRKENSSNTYLSSTTLGSTSSPHKNKRKKSKRSSNHVSDTTDCLCCVPCLRIDHNDPHIEEFYDNLRNRYQKSKNNLNENQKNQSLFYFDETLTVLNDILGNRKDIKANQVYISDSPEQEYEEFSIKLTRKFHLTAFLKWFILLNFIIYAGVSIFYLLFWKFRFNANADLDVSTPFFIYAGCSFVLEAILCAEIIHIINNPDIITMSSNIVVFSLITSQATRYDYFAYLAYCLSTFDYNPVTNDITLSKISIAAFFVSLLKSFFLYQEFIWFFWRGFCKKRKGKKTYSSKNINFFCQSCFSFEFHALGRLLDKFSTASAQKYKYWWLPKSLYNVYIPFVITVTFRLFIVDIPQLSILLIDIINEKKSDITIMASFCATVIVLLMTLHTAWNVKPSYFDRDLFKLYHESLMRTKDGEDEGSISDTSSHVDTYFEQSENRSAISMEEKDQMMAFMKEEGEEKDDERDELFGGGGGGNTAIPFFAKEEI